MPSALAAVFERPGELPALRPIALPELCPGEVLVRIHCCTICGSDVHSWTGKRHTPMPSILGHEIVGVVESLGPGEPAVDLDWRSLAVGDRIVWAVVASCGTCERCIAGMPQKCLSAWKYGHQALEDVPSRRVSASPLSGGLATHCHLVAGTAIVRVPANVPDELASTATCAGATVCAALSAVGDLTGRRVLVAGAGMLGLLTCAMASRQRTRSVTAVDLNTDRLAEAVRLGATSTGTTIPDGSFDVLIECTGKASVSQAAIERLDVGGCVALVGAVYPDQPIALDAQWVVRRMLTIRGVHNYTPRDLAAAVAFLADRSVVVAMSPLIGPATALSDIARWTQVGESGLAARTPVRPDNEGSLAFGSEP